MEVVVLPTARENADIGAEAVAQTLAANPAATLGLATGSSPVATYRRLQEMCSRGEISLASCSAFTLDEYVGLPADSPQLYRNVIRRDFSDGTDLPMQHLHSPPSDSDDVVAACAEYEEKINDAGGIDLQILGLGSDGHIAFNEPGSSLASRTRIKTLTEQTRRDNARFFDDDVDAVPTHCITQGVGTIMEARHILMLISGQEKATAVSAMIEGPVSASCPASALQFHPHVTVLLDDAAASNLERLAYYREAYLAKPAWQRW